MIILAEINDDLVKRWGSMFINNPNYDVEKASYSLPGFEFEQPKDNGEEKQRPPFRLRILTEKQIQQMALSNINSYVKSMIKSDDKKSSDEESEQAPDENIAEEASSQEDNEPN